MDQQGKASLPFAPKGLIDPEAIAMLRQAGDFPNQKTADKAARKKGWVVVDGNHRCPDCAKRPEPTPARRGAYIKIPDSAASSRAARNGKNTVTNHGR